MSFHEMEVWMWALLTAIGLLALLSSSAHYRFLRVLRERHEETWRELGSPRFFLNSPTISARMHGFIVGKSYEELHDTELSRLGSFLRVSSFVVALLLAGMLVFLMPLGRG